MSERLRVKGSDLLKALQRHGFEVVRIRGSHHFVKHPDGRGTAIPVHSGETIGPGLLSKILREIEFTREELKDIL